MPTSSLAAVLKFNGDPRGAVDAINKVGNTIKNLEGKVNGLNQRMNSSGSQGSRIFGSLIPVLNSVHRTVTNVSNSTRLLAQGITNVGRAVMFFIGLPLAAALTAGFRVAISYEDALVRVAKTTGFATAQLESLSTGIRNLAIRTVSSHIELAAMAEQLGQLGVRSVPEILKFLKVFDMVATATDISGDVVAKEMGKIAAAFGWNLNSAADDVNRLANVINMLENNTAASAGEIVDALFKFAPTAKLLNITAAEAAGLTAALISTGLSADEAGTSLRNMFLKITQNSDRVAELMVNTERYSTQEQVLNAIRDDSVGLILDITAAMAEETDTARKLLGIFEMTEIRGGKALAGLAVNAEGLQRVLDMSNEEWIRASSLVGEYERALLSTQSHLKVLKNNVNDAAITLANTFLPTINRIIEYAIPGIRLLAEWFGRLEPRVKFAAVGFLLLVTVLGPVLFFFGQMVHGLSLIGLGMSGVISMFAGTVKTIALFGAALASLNPIALLVAAGITGAAIVILKALQGVGVDVAGFFRNLADRASTWGENLAASYANGLVSGAIRTITAAITYIAELIASFFESKSPPAAGPLSHIDQWGKTLFDTYLKSFAKADFSILTSIGSRIQKILSNLNVVGKVGDTQKFTFLAVARENLAKLIKIFNDTGKISDKVLNQVVQHLGEASDEVAQLIRYQLEYNRLQNELAELERNRDSLLATYREEISLIAQSNMSAEEKAEAIRQAKLNRDQELRTIEEQKLALEDEAEIAKENVDWQQAMVDAMLEQDEIQSGLIAALEKLNKTLDAMDGFAFPEVPEFDIDENLGETIADAFEPFLTLDERIESARKGLDFFMKGLRGEDLSASDLVGLDEETIKEYQNLYDTGLKIHDTWTGIQDSLQSVSDLFAGIGETLDGALAGLTDPEEGSFVAGIMEDLERFSNWVSEHWPIIQHTLEQGWLWLQKIFETASELIGPELEELVTAVNDLLDELDIDGLEELGDVFKLAGMIIAGTALWLIGIFVGLVTAIADFVGKFTGHIAEIQRAREQIAQGFGEFWEGLKLLFSDGEGSIRERIDKILEALGGLGAGIWNILIGIGGLLLTGMRAGFDATIGLVVEFIANVIAFFYNLYHKLVGGSIVPDMMGDIEDAVRGGLDKVLEFFSTILTNVWTKVEEIFGNIWSSITTWFATNVGEWQAKWEEFREKAREALSTLWEVVQEKLDEIPTRAAAAVEGIKDWFQGLGEGFIEALKTGFDNAKEALFETLTGIFNDLLKKAQPILDLLDKVGVKIEVPVIPSGGTSTNTPSATGFASGGIATRPMFGMIAEGGESEAIIPLSRLPSMFNAIAGSGAGSNVPNIEININNPTVRSDDDIRRLTALIKDEISKEITNALRFGGSLR